jgi:pyruvate,water dikinase
MNGLRHLFRRAKKIDAIDGLSARLEAFRDLLEQNNRVLELIGDAGEKLGGDYLFDSQYLRWLDRELASAVEAVVRNLQRIAPGRHADLQAAFQRIRAAVGASLSAQPVAAAGPLILDLRRVRTEQAGWAGEKMARLGEVGSRLGASIPSGFVVTAHAFAQLLADPDLAALIGRAAAEDADLAEISAALKRAVETRKLPSAVKGEIKRALGGFGRQARFAVRSSAIGEDGELSFAGMHKSLINVPRSDVPGAYLRVVASLYAERPLRYRRHHQDPLAGAAMAVGCMLMVPAVASGVAYSLDPSAPQEDEVLISAAWGLGGTVVEGIGASDSFRVSRRSPHGILDRRLAVKETMQTAEGSGGVRTVEVPAAKRAAACLSDPVLTELATLVLAIERHMRHPQDIEWAVDAEARIWVLQARPLRLSAPPPDRSRDVQRATAAHEVLMRDHGEVACRGIGAGEVIVADPGMSLASFRPGSVLVARYPSPGLSAFVAVASAVVTDAGAPTGHLATIAREHRVPTIVNAKNATTLLSSGMEVTVDAEENIVYAGVVRELIRYGLLQSDAYSDTREFRTLRSMLAGIAPLNLREPGTTDFSPTACRTYHDIIRFAHETALTQLSDLSGLDLGRRDERLRRLDLDIPLDLLLIDVGGGLEAGTDGAVIPPAGLACEPLKILLDGLTEPGVWATTPADMDLAGFMASATRSVVLTMPGAAAVERNLAIISGNYLNLSLRLGYHFNVIDAYLGQGEEDSYLLFRFVGGVTELTRRERRAALLCKILSHYDFAVDRTGDLVVARLNNAARPIVEQRLRMVGRLVGFTRQLDIQLRDENTVQRFMEEFLLGRREKEGKDMGSEGGMTDAIQVLVLDDEPAVGERLKDFLEKNGMAVEAFLDSQAAIDRLAHKHFDVVVTDLKMKGPTGLDVLVHVRERELATQVIIITAYGTFEHARGAEVVGAFDFIHKPFKLVDIHKLVKKAAKKARRQAS